MQDPLHTLSLDYEGSTRPCARMVIGAETHIAPEERRELEALANITNTDENDREVRRRANPVKIAHSDETSGALSQK